MKLNLGCGPFPMEGYINVDHYMLDKADVDDNVIMLLKFANECAEEVYASHVLEHLGYNEGRLAVYNWCRVLKPGGKATILVPDFPTMLRWWLHKYDSNPRPDNMWLFPTWTIYGQQQNDGEYHKWGYDIQQLSSMLVIVGFKNVLISKVPGLYDGTWYENLVLKAEAVK